RPERLLVDVPVARLVQLQHAPAGLPGSLVTTWPVNSPRFSTSAPPGVSRESRPPSIPLRRLPHLVAGARPGAGPVTAPLPCIRTRTATPGIPKRVPAGWHGAPAHPARLTFSKPYSFLNLIRS